MIEQCSNRWFHCRLPRAKARIRLLCFPPAGGAPVQFFHWPDLLPEEIEVHVAQLPGRERRRHEPLPRDGETLLSELATAAAALETLPLAFYGHSMGALLAFEVARRRQTVAQPPVHLFIAARRAPHLRGPLKPLHHLPDKEFLWQLQHRWGALPRAIIDNPELVDYFLPVIRADIAMLETYQYQPGAPLRCPITVYGGQHDPSTAASDLEAWRDQTERDFRLRIFDGDHFFPQSLRQHLIEDLNSTLMREGACRA